MIGIKILEERKSKHNGDIKVVRSLGLGTYIQAGGITQSGGIVKEFWKKTLRKVRSEKLKVKSCLILGLGGGTVAKLVRKYWPETKITGVDIDPEMVDLGRKYLGLDSSRVKIKIQDAFDFCTSTYQLVPNVYDLILVDLYVGDKIPKEFESKRFRRLVHGLLTDSGIAVFNRLYFDRKRPEAIKFGNKLEKIFEKVDWFYPQANLMFLCYNK